MLNWDEILIRLSIACLFGGLIGLERERKDWTAGMRTHMMVCVGSSLIMIVSSFGFSDFQGTPNITLDPSRMAAQVISGIGFIGAGTILFLEKETIKGLTTAAGLWTVAAIGLATGCGMYFAAAATTIIALIILWGLQSLEIMYFRKFKQQTLTIITNPNIDNTELIKYLSNNNRLKIQNFTFEKNDNEFIFQIKLDNIEIKKMNSVIDELKKDSAIKKISWNH